jgi:protein LSM12
VNTTNGNQTQPGDYHIIPISRIHSFQLIALPPSVSTADGASFTDAYPPLHPLDIRALKARESSTVAKIQEREARRGKGVTREAQDLFDAFSRTMPAKWDGTSIVVADAVVIAKPYRVNDCRPLVPGDSALARVRKVVRIFHHLSTFFCLIPLDLGIRN